MTSPEEMGLIDPGVGPNEPDPEYDRHGTGGTG